MKRGCPGDGWVRGHLFFRERSFQWKFTLTGGVAGGRDWWTCRRLRLEPAVGAILYLPTLACFHYLWRQDGHPASIHFSSTALDHRTSHPSLTGRGIRPPSAMR
jgi:hypothetical protein